MSALPNLHPWRRRLVLGSALVAALAATAMAPSQRTPLVMPAYAQAPAGAPAISDREGAPHAATPKSPGGTDPANATGSHPTDSAGADSPAATGATPGDSSEAAPAASSKRRHHGATIGITVDDDDKVRVQGLGPTHEYDSFEDFMRQSPWIAGLFFLSMLLVFLIPLLVIVLVLWYKMRKTRMLNETMLKLAERGVVPPAEAMDAIGAARPQAAIESGTTTGALYARAQRIRSRGVWSDLRRGVVLVALGLAFQFSSMLSDGEVSLVGMILLFLGIGYVVLWYFEDRGTQPIAAGGTGPGTDRGADRAP